MDAAAVQHGELDVKPGSPAPRNQHIGDEVHQRRLPDSDAIAHGLGAQVGVIGHLAQAALRPLAQPGHQRTDLLTFKRLVHRQISRPREPCVGDRHVLAPHGDVHLADKTSVRARLDNGDTVHDVAHPESFLVQRLVRVPADDQIDAAPGQTLRQFYVARVADDVRAGGDAVP